MTESVIHAPPVRRPRRPRSASAATMGQPALTSPLRLKVAGRASKTSIVLHTIATRFRPRRNPDAAGRRRCLVSANLSMLDRCQPDSEQFDDDLAHRRRSCVRLAPKATPGIARSRPDERWPTLFSLSTPSPLRSSTWLFTWLANGASRAPAASRKTRAADEERMIAVHAASVAGLVGAFQIARGERGVSSVEGRAYDIDL